MHTSSDRVRSRSHRGTQLQPDNLVYPSRFSPTTDWVRITEYWLAVEVLSRSSRMYDREFKRDAYFALGLREVWLVDARNECVEVCRDRGPGEITRDVIEWRPPALDVTVSMPLDQVFAGIWTTDQP